MLTLAIIAVTAVLSIAAFMNHAIFEKLCLNPYVMHRDKKEYFRFISVAFVHANYAHLLLNMLTLYFFGTVIEGHILSETQYLLFYLSASVMSALNEYINQKDNPEYKACGASGAVSAIMFMLVLFNPWGMVYITFVVPVYFVLFAVGFLIYSYYMDHKKSGRIAHGIHFWGALYGIAFTLLLKPESLRIFIELIRQPPFLK